MDQALLGRLCPTDFPSQYPVSSCQFFFFGVGGGGGGGLLGELCVHGGVERGGRIIVHTFHFLIFLPLFFEWQVVYFLLSAAQICTGYPSTVQRNALTRHVTSVGVTIYFIYKVGGRFNHPCLFGVDTIECLWLLCLPCVPYS